MSPDPKRGSVPGRPGGRAAQRSPQLQSELVAALEHAIDAQRQGRLTEAAASYRIALRIDPQDFDALHMMGVVHYELGEFNDAVDLLTQAVQLRPDVPAARANLLIVRQVQLKEQQLCWEVLPRLAKLVDEPIALRQWLSPQRTTHVIVSSGFLPENKSIFRSVVRSSADQVELWSERAARSLPDARLLRHGGPYPEEGDLLLLGEELDFDEWLSCASLHRVALLVTRGAPGAIIDRIRRLSNEGTRLVGLFCPDTSLSRRLGLPVGTV